MKIITSIYLNCRPDLRDEWIAPTDADAEVEEALVSYHSFYSSLLIHIIFRFNYYCHYFIVIILCFYYNYYSLLYYYLYNHYYPLLSF